MKPRITTMTQALMSKGISSTMKTVKCRQCDKVIKIGDLMVTKRSTKRTGNYTKWYHLLCAERLNIV